jgi:hypothetical protein
MQWVIKMEIGTNTQVHMQIHTRENMEVHPWASSVMHAGILSECKRTACIRRACILWVVSIDWYISLCVCLTHHHSMYVCTSTYCVYSLICTLRLTNSLTCSEKSLKRRAASEYLALPFCEDISRSYKLGSSNKGKLLSPHMHPKGRNACRGHCAAIYLYVWNIAIL